MGIFNQKTKQDDDEEHAKVVTYQEEGKPNIDFRSYQLGDRLYMAHDPNFVDRLRDTGREAFIAAFSPLNRMTNIGKKEKKILELDFEGLTLFTKMMMEEDEYETDGWAELEGWKIYAQGMVSDAFHGWKGKLMTEFKKTVATEIEKKKKRTIF